MNDFLEYFLAALALLPFLGIISTSESNSTDARAGASDEANAATLGGIAADQSGESFTVSSFSNAARDTGQVGIGSNQARDNAVVNQGRLNTGLEFGNVGGGVVIETSSDDVAKSALEKVADFARSALSSIGRQTEGQVAALKDLSESRQTGGESTVNRNVLYIALAAIAGTFGLVWLFRK